MRKKHISKELLVAYLLSKPDTDLTREEIVRHTGISKSRLSELIHEIRSDGYEISTPSRSGIVRLESGAKIAPDINPKEIRQWLILLALSKSGLATYMELICSILSIADHTYLYDGITADQNYTNMDILKYLKEFNPAAKDDIDRFLPLPTLRKDLHALIRSGYVDQKRVPYKGGIHVVYSISEKSPAILFESEDELYDFMVFYDNFRDSLSNTTPLESLYQKITNIYDWESYDSAVQIYGKSNRIGKNQLAHLNNFTQYPYKTKSLCVKYITRECERNLTIDSGLLFYSAETNYFYLLCMNTADGGIMQLRLDRMASIREDNRENKHYRSLEFMNLYDEMFSAAYDSKKTHVKVLFQDFGNIRERLNTLHSRRKHSKLYEIEPLTDHVPHSIVYEDDLRGMSAFSRYLRSFGSSALVLEPAGLRELMIQSNQKILNHYENLSVHQCTGRTERADYNEKKSYF